MSEEMGEKVRPRQVSREEWERRWAETFDRETFMAKVRFPDGSVGLLPVEIHPGRGIVGENSREAAVGKNANRPPYGDSPS